MIIQAFLIAASLGIFALLLRQRSAARARAWKKLIFLALVLVAILTILYPDASTTVANVLGVGRGTDLLLYGLTAVFLYIAVGFYLKFRDIERQLTILARRQAIDEALRRHGSGLGESD